MALCYPSFPLAQFPVHPPPTRPLTHLFPHPIALCYPSFPLAQFPVHPPPTRPLTHLFPHPLTLCYPSFPLAQFPVHPPPTRPLTHLFPHPLTLCYPSFPLAHFPVHPPPTRLLTIDGLHYQFHNEPNDLGAVLLTVGRCYVGNDVTHSTLLDRACASSYKNLPKYRSYCVSNTAPWRPTFFRDQC